MKPSRAIATRRQLGGRAPADSELYGRRQRKGSGDRPCAPGKKGHLPYLIEPSEIARRCNEAEKIFSR